MTNRVLYRDGALRLMRQLQDTGVRIPGSLDFPGISDSAGQIGGSPDFPGISDSAGQIGGSPDFRAFRILPVRLG